MVYTPPYSSHDKDTSFFSGIKRWFRRPGALEKLPVELFRRLVGLYSSIPEKTRYSEEYKSISMEFESLRDFIDERLTTDGRKYFEKNELGNYVHNLNLLLIGVIQVGFLEANIASIKEEYKGHVDEMTFKSFATSCINVYVLEKACTELSEEEYKKYEERLRLEYRNLTNEIRRARLYEEHIENTRTYLMRSVIIPYALTILLPVVFLFVPASSDELILFSMSAISGATGSLLSVLLRIQGVLDNNKLAQNIVAFKFSVNAVRIAPFTGFVFAVVLSFIFSGGLVAGSLFPKETSWHAILYDKGEVSKWLTWSFIAGFSERMVPDIIDRLSDKAKKGEKT